MKTFATFHKKLKALNVKAIATDAADSVKDLAANLNREQMMKGETFTGEKIGQYRAIEYAEEKFGMNTRAGAGFVDLRYKGKFQDNIFALKTGSFKNYGLKIVSKDDKTAKLVHLYGNDIFGLNDENERRLRAAAYNRASFLISDRIK